ncbi:hypothetical protein B7R25_03370 [Subtercola boreus]|uniref:Uncharacterized protein n=1 Tax=Subtercola boreus TaxID=120213 RepID=A0A3E0WCZ5_9MICO|nr:hypothetical protein B7R24_03360 [Subtercola boreus]RFA23020.1 hypothetical protein B7R23_03355 [Subtercola boreus]RFA28772.1 hypothetical protein B7R25_03370 [Subtercola boreus]
MAAAAVGAVVEHPGLFEPVRMLPTGALARPARTRRAEAVRAEAVRAEAVRTEAVRTEAVRTRAGRAGARIARVVARNLGTGLGARAGWRDGVR